MKPHALQDRKSHTSELEAESRRLQELEGRAALAADNLQRYLRQLPQDRQLKVMRQLKAWLEA